MKQLLLLLTWMTMGCEADARPALSRLQRTPPRQLVAIGDSRTANRSDSQTPWPEQIPVAVASVANLAVPGRVWATCTTQVVDASLETAVQCGVNDILADTAGVTLANTEISWLETRAAANRLSYWMNIPGFKGYDDTASRRTERNNFNTRFASYCAGAHSSLIVCVDIASYLDDPNDPDALLNAYSLDDIHYTTAGHAVIRQRFEAVRPQLR